MYEDDFNIEEWKAKKREERQAAFTAQEQALHGVFSSGQKLADYFYQRGKLGSHITAGNAALILNANPLACAVMSAEEWNKYGRRVSKGAVGIPQIVRNNGYYAVAKVFDISQTYGNKPYPIASVQENQLAQAVNAFAAVSPIPFSYTSDSGRLHYDAQQDEIVIPNEMPDEEVIQLLPAQIVLASAEHSYEKISENEFMKQTATAVAVEVCGRLGLAMPSDAAELLNGMQAPIPEGEERRALEQVRELAAAFGDFVCHQLKLERSQPAPQREER